MPLYVSILLLAAVGTINVCACWALKLYGQVRCLRLTGFSNSRVPIYP